GDGQFPDCALGPATVVLELAHAPNVDGENGPDGSCHELPSFRARLASAVAAATEAEPRLVISPDECRSRRGGPRRLSSPWSCRKLLSATTDPCEHRHRRSGLPRSPSGPRSDT